MYILGWKIAHERLHPCYIVERKMHVLSISCCRAIFTGFVVWDVEELEVVQAIVGVQPPFPGDFTAALLHDRALAAAEHGEVAAFS